MSIQGAEVRGLFTKYLVNKLEIKASPTLFLKSFFKTKTTSAKNVSIEVKRHGEPIAVDVKRTAGPNMNSWSKSTEKIWEPPFFNEGFTLNELDGYDRIFGEMQEVTEDNFAMVLGEAGDKIQLLKDKINRKYELMCAQVLQTGIVTLVNGDNIDFKRQAASKGVLGAGNWWTETSVDPSTTLQEAAKFIRTQGLAAGSTFNVIFGEAAWNAYVNNPKIQNLADNRRFNLQDIVSPIPFGLGSDFLGRVSAGTYNFNCWGYERFYNPAGTDKTGKESYIDPKQIIVLPNDIVMDQAYAGVPHVKRGTSAEFPEYIALQPGEFFIDNYLDKKHANHEFYVKSAGIPIPTQVDAIFNKQVVA